MVGAGEEGIPELVLVELPLDRAAHGNQRLLAWKFGDLGRRTLGNELRGVGSRRGRGGADLTAKSRTDAGRDETERGSPLHEFAAVQISTDEFLRERLDGIALDHPAVPPLSGWRPCHDRDSFSGTMCPTLGTERGSMTGGILDRRLS